MLTGTVQSAMEKDLAGQVSPNVDTKNVEVTLTAKGKSEAAHYLAIEIAKDFDHVTDVEDNLQIVKISTAPLSKQPQEKNRAGRGFFMNTVNQAYLNQC
jgi:osmotically-inducible protein OsmY